MTYISSLSLSAPARQSVMGAQSALAQAQAEVSSGTPADLGMTLGARTGTVLSLRAEVDRLNGYDAGNASAATRLSATANTLSSLLATAQGTAASLLTASSAGGNVDAMSATARSALSGLVSGLNTAVAGQSLFGGINTGATPMADDFTAPTSPLGTAIASAFSTFVANNGGDASALTAAQFRSFVDTAVTPLFDAPGWSAASSTAVRTAVSPAQTVTTSVSADETAFRQVAEAYTVLATFTGAGSPLGAAAKAGAAAAATTLLSSGIAGLTGLQAEVGVAQKAVDAAAAQNAAQATTLQGSADDLDSVDVYALSGRVTALQNQLEASYELTSRLQSLSLTNYLAG